MDAIDNILDNLMTFAPGYHADIYKLAEQIAGLETAQREELTRTMDRIARFANNAAPDKQGAEFTFRPADTRRRGRPRGSKNRQAEA